MVFLISTSQSFSVDDIRRFRTEAEKRYENMPFDKVMRDISEGAKEGLEILARLKQEKVAQQRM